MDELLAEFIAETRETLDKISNDLVAWEADSSDRARLDEIFRFIHTVKGSCGFLDLPRLERLSHHTEDTLQAFRSGERDASPALVSAILAVTDRIADLVDRLERGESIENGDDEDLLEAMSSGGEEAGLREGQALPCKSEPSRNSSARSIRVPVALLDQLMGGVSDLVLARNELSRQLRGIDATPALDSAFERLSQRIAEIRDGVTWTRMQRIESLFAAVPRLVRDLANQLGKQVLLEIEGEDVELDREMIEMLRDPLTHAVRNAIDHGIESPEDRRAAGKPESGTLELSARQSGNQIEIAIRDDGRGIDTARLAKRAVAAKIVSEAEGASLGERALLDLIFHPGLSTAASATEISGRGVGMDVVRANVERIGGSIAVDSHPGHGTTLSLSVPLTLTIIPALVVGVGDHHFALPRLAIDEIIAADKEAVRIEPIGDGETVVLRSERLPLLRADAVIGEVQPSADGRRDAGIVVILGIGRGRRFGLLVSEVLDHEELVVKPAAPMLLKSGIFAGTSLPDDGKPLLLLDATGIAMRAGLSWSSSLAMVADPKAEVSEAAHFDALVFDDLDGTRRAIALSVIDRIDRVDVNGIMESGGIVRAMVDGELVPLVTNGNLPESGEIGLFRLSDGEAGCGYGFAGKADVIAFPVDYSRTSRPGRIAGVAMLEGQPVELLDPHQLLVEAGGGAVSGERPRCRIEAADPNWARALLGPLVELAGYKVVYDDQEDGGPADMVIVADGRRDQTDRSGVANEILYLSDIRDDGDGRIYRYDREGIFEALRSRRRATGGGR